MNYDEAVALVRRYPALVGVSWTGTVPGGGRVLYDEGDAPRVLQVLAALDLADLAANYPDSTYRYDGDRAAALLAEALAACTREELEALLIEGPGSVRQAAFLEIGRRA